MTKRQQKKAFDRYYRSRTVLESGKGGFGIGLCTAREFAEAMGGTLSVRSNTPKGCVFTLELPADA
jgi:signal transduction histidine kinase